MTRRNLFITFFRLLKNLFKKPEDKKLFKEAQKRFKLLNVQFQTIDHQKEEDRNFFDGDQWPDKHKIIIRKRVNA